MLSPETTVIKQGQPSWRLNSDAVETFVTRTGGHAGPVTFDVDGRDIEPYSVAPWVEEKEAIEDQPPMLGVLRGDFFCMPFGSNDVPYNGEHHPPHGETANEPWHFKSLQREGGVSSLHLSLETTVRKGHVDKVISLIDGHRAVYSRHTITDMDGVMNLGHHAMLKFPDIPGSGLISTSRICYAQVTPEPLELPENRGYSMLRTGATFDRLNAIPTLTHEFADRSRYPAEKGFEDLVMLVADPDLELAWTAVSYPEAGYVWFALKNPRVLRNTILWMSNGGRHYPPWNGRHIGVLGLEEVTSYFHFGIAQSAEANPLSAMGVPTTLTLESAKPLKVEYIMAVAAIPTGFDRVKRLETSADKDEVTLTSESGVSIDVPLRHRFIAR